jgi:hypothetical protein
MAMLPLIDQGRLSRPTSVHGATSAQSRVTVVRRCGGSACIRAAALVNKQHLARKGAFRPFGISPYSHCSRKRIACRAEQQEQEQVDPELVPQRDPATTTRPLQVTEQSAQLDEQVKMFLGKARQNTPSTN